MIYKLTLFCNWFKRLKNKTLIIIIDTQRVEYKGVMLIKKCGNTMVIWKTRVLTYFWLEAPTRSVFKPQEVHVEWDVILCKII